MENRGSERYRPAEQPAAHLSLLFSVSSFIWFGRSGSVYCVLGAWIAKESLGLGQKRVWITEENFRGSRESRSHHRIASHVEINELDTEEFHSA